MGSFVYIIILVSGLVLASLSIVAEKKYKISNMWQQEKKQKDIFDLMARFLYGIYYKYFFNHKQNLLIVDFLLQAPHVKHDLLLLNPSKKIENVIAQYYIQKIRQLLLIFYVGSLIAFFAYLSAMEMTQIREGNLISKNFYGEGKKTINAQCISEDGEMEKFEVTVEEYIYTKKELEELFEEAIRELENIILENNVDTEHVDRDLALVDYVEGYPFQLKWESSDYYLVDHKGKIQKDKIMPQGEIVTLSCTFMYRDWEKQYQIPIRVYEPIRTGKEKWIEDVKEELDRTTVQQRYDEKFTLPTKIQGKDVAWKEIKSNNGIILLIVFLVAGFCVYGFKDQELHKKIEIRNDEILKEYPVLVNRLILYLGAGMAVKSAWFKIAYDYQKNKEKMQYVYEEMLLTCHEIQSGISEGIAYEKFGERCGLQAYTRLAGLLSQSIRKGNATLLQDLHKEATWAQEERKNYVRKKGEEAGTKLLLPMMMMLGIVIALIMLPAFLSFST